jgi:hypothetical protein
MKDTPPEGDRAEDLPKEDPVPSGQSSGHGTSRSARRPDICADTVRFTAHRAGANAHRGDARPCFPPIKDLRRAWSEP